MKKVIIFGTGSFWENWKDNLNKDYEIIAFSDNNPKSVRGGMKEKRLFHQTSLV